LFVVNLALIPAGLFFQLIMFAQLAFYMAAFVGYLQARQNKKSKLLYVPYYFCLMNYAVFAGFTRWRKGKQAAAWERAKRA
jgi:hypothetical protein